MIELRALSTRILRDVTFTVPQGGYGIVIGPTGAGKTTLLEVIAGLVPPRSGGIWLGGENLTLAKPEARRLSIVYQHGYLFPHLGVRENVAYGAASADAAAEMLDRFGLEPLVHRHVGSLSGGERQLVALARALARRPEVLLLDEPFSALDPQNRAAVRRVVRTIYYERRFTVLQVTHDFGEAGLLGDMAVLLDGGRVLQAGDPAELFRKPASPYIANFLGAENVFAGEARPIREAAPDFAGTDATSVAHAVAFTTGALTMYALGDVVPGPAHAVLRAEDVSLSVDMASSSVRNQFRGRIIEIMPAGALTRVTIEVSGTMLVSAVTSRSAQELQLAPGKEVVAAFKATSVHLC